MGESRSVHYPLAFSTLACPDWSWEQAVQKAVEYGYQGLELRGVEGEEPEVALPDFVRVLRTAEAELASRQEGI